MPKKNAIVSRKPVPGRVGRARRTRRPRRERTNRKTKTTNQGTVVTAPAQTGSIKVGHSKIGSTESWAKISPEAQFQVAMLSPGSFNCPFVEDHEPSKYPTSIFPGFQNVDRDINLNAYTVMMWCPSWGGVNGLSGFQLNVSTLTTDTASMSVSLSKSVSSIYGSTIAFSKFFSFAGTIDFDIQGPMATTSGVAYIGSLPFKSFQGSTIQTLMVSATSMIDLKSTSKFSIKSRIQDRSIIHNNTIVTNAGPPIVYEGDTVFEEEAVAYAILPPGAFRSITDGSTAMPFNIQMKFRTHAMWLPAVSTPTLAAVARSDAISIAPQTPIQEVACQRMEYSSYAPQPVGRSVIGKIVDALAIGSSFFDSLIPGGKILTASLEAAAGMLSDTWVDVKTTTTEVEDLEWFQQQIGSRWRPAAYDASQQAAFESYIAATQHFIEVCRETQQQQRKHALSRQDYEHRIVSDFSGTKITYWKDGVKVDPKTLARNLIARSRSKSPPSSWVSNEVRQAADSRR